MSQNSKITTDTCPILLLDCSGSTEHSINLKKHKDYEHINTVLKYQVDKAKRLFTSMSIKFVYVILWNFKAQVCSMTPILVSDLSKIPITSLGGTCLSKGLDAIPEEWIKNKEKELYIFTDGEIEDEQIVVGPLKRLIDSNITIQIITIEPNDTNYIQTKGDAGHKIFQTIKNNNLTKSVRRFSSYNENHVYEPFISFDNPKEIDGFAAFQGVYYNIDDQQDELVDKVEEAIKACETKDEVIKLAHDLSTTIHHMTKDKDKDESNEINNQFGDLFAESSVDPGIFTQVNKMLLLEAGNLSNGSGSSYHEFKDALILYDK